MLRADGVVYIFFIIINHTMRDAGRLALLRRAGKILARTGRIPSGSWICLRHRNEMNRTTNDVHVHRHGGIAGQNTDPKPPVPGACFSKAPETFRARKAIFN